MIPIDEWTNCNCLDRNIEVLPEFVWGYECLTTPYGDCIRNGLANCTNVKGGWWWGFGHFYFIVTRRSSNICEIEITNEKDLAYTVQSCRYQYPTDPWLGLSGTVYHAMDEFPGTCETIINCNIFNPNAPCPTEIAQCEGHILCHD